MTDAGKAHLSLHFNTSLVWAVAMPLSGLYKVTTERVFAGLIAINRECKLFFSCQLKTGGVFAGSLAAHRLCPDEAATPCFVRRVVYLRLW